MFLSMALNPMTHHQILFVGAVPRRDMSANPIECRSETPLPQTLYLFSSMLKEKKGLGLRWALSAEIQGLLMFPETIRL